MGGVRALRESGDTASMDAGSVNRIRRALDATLAAGTAHVATYTSFDDPMPEEADARGVGVVDFANGRSQVSDRMIRERMLDESARRDSRLARTMKRGLSGSTELLFDRGHRYTRTDAGDWNLEPGDGGPERSQRDPLWVLSLLAGGNDDVAPAGVCDVRRTPTEHLRLTLDFHWAARATPGGLGMPDVAPRRWLRRGPVANDSWIDAGRVVARQRGARTTGERRTSHPTRRRARVVARD